MTLKTTKKGSGLGEMNKELEDVPQSVKELNSGVIRAPIDPNDLGQAVISPAGAFEAGSYQSFTLTYTAGVFGIDDSGSLRVCFRFASDQSNPQFDDPKGANFCDVTASNGAELQVRFDPKANVRPWDRTLWIKVVKGYLKEGDQITIRFGVKDHGGPGMRMQTFCEDTFEFRTLVDPIATYNFQTLSEQPTISIVPGPPERFVAVLPTKRRPGQIFALKVKGEDRWGNPSNLCDHTFTVASTAPIAGLPDDLKLVPSTFATVIDGLTVEMEGTLSISLLDASGEVVAKTNPLVIEDTPLIHFWGDIHGQSEETIGTGSAREYFAFARDRAFVDACGHQGNDFQISDAFWEELGRLTREFDEAGRFIALPGYEWSGNTALGGDRNVYFPTEGRIIRRSSHALVDDDGTRETDCITAAKLFEAFAANEEFDVVCFAHCGGRYADIEVAHDGRFERSVEVHSSWGTFEWLVADAFRLGYRVGIVANSDGHKGRPGASYPGAGKFGAIGGLTCYLMESLTRESLLDCLRKRRHFATTGARLLVDVRAQLESEGTLYHDDPKLGSAIGASATEAMMGDIIHLPNGCLTLQVNICAHAPIERVDIFNGSKHITTKRPYAEEELGNRIRIMWEGATYRGRFRQVIWDGSAKLSENTVVSANPINFFNRDKVLRIDDPTTLSWQALTTGNFGGVDMVLEHPSSGTLQIDTPLVKQEIPLSQVALEDMIFDASGELPRLLKISRYPAVNHVSNMAFDCDVDLNSEGDNPLYIRVTLEDGSRAWSSPIYVYR